MRMVLNTDRWNYRIVRGVFLGLFTPLVFLLGTEPFEHEYVQNPLNLTVVVKVIVAGSLAVALYFAACQFWFVRGTRAPHVNWPILGAMVAPLLAWCFLIFLAYGGGREGLFNSLPMLISGCVGGVAGNLLAVRRTIAVPPGSHPR